MAAVSRFEFQNEEAQAEHSSHLLQFAGSELQTLPVKQSGHQWAVEWTERRQRSKGEARHMPIMEVEN